MSEHSVLLSLEELKLELSLLHDQSNKKLLMTSMYNANNTQ
jgi:hypothetical protein